MMSGPKVLLTAAVAGAVLIGLGCAAEEPASAPTPAVAVPAADPVPAETTPATRPARQTPDAQRNWSNTPRWPQDLPGGPRHKTFRSELVQQDVGYTIWLPPAYEEKPDARFPVVYYLHGIGGNEVDGALPFSRDLQKAMDAGKCPPTIFVMVNGYLDSFYVDSYDKTTPVESIIIKELIPHIDQTYRTVADRNGRAIMGFSMGGYGSMRLGLKHPEIFSAIMSLSGAYVGQDMARTRGRAAFAGHTEYFIECDPATIAKANADKVRGRMAILLACGDQDGLMARNKQFEALLNELNIDHDFRTVPGVGHDAVQMFAGLDGAIWATAAKGFAMKDPPVTAPRTRPEQERRWSNTPPWEDVSGGPRHKTFFSDLVKQDVGYTIWLPAEYEAKAEARFPVIYNLHGVGGNEVDGAMPFSRDLRKAIDAGQCPPAIFVMVNGYLDSGYTDTRAPVESMIIKELIPHIDKTYRTVAKRDGRAIVGFSMGGRGSMYLGLKYPEMFSSIVPMAGAFVGRRTGSTDPDALLRENADKIRGRTAILLVCGDEDNLLERNQRFDAALTELNIEHGFKIVPGVGHDVVKLFAGLEGAVWQTAAKGFGFTPAVTQPAN